MIATWTSKPLVHMMTMNLHALSAVNIIVRRTDVKGLYYPTYPLQPPDPIAPTPGRHRNVDGGKRRPVQQ